MSFVFSLERWPNGWVFCSAPNRSGIPIDALASCVKLFPKGAIMDAGICTHLIRSKKSRAVCCVATPAGSKSWRTEIETELANSDPETRWFMGVDSGTSSTAIFACFCREEYRFEAKETGRGSMPMDSDDLGRCIRLLASFPEWKARLSEVAMAYPDTKWAALVARWNEITAMTGAQQTAALRSL